MPGHFWYHLAIAVSAGQLGLSEEARVAVDELLGVIPDFAKRARAIYAAWNFPDELIDHLLEGLRKAGLEISS